MQLWKLMGLSAAAMVSLAACSTAPSANTAGNNTTTSAPAMNPSSLEQTLRAYHWDLERAEDQGGRALPAFTALAPKTVVRLSFIGGDKPGDQRIAVSNLCNRLGGGYQLDGEKITVSNPIATMMACSDSKLMQLEQAVSAQISRAQSVRLTPGNTGTAPQRLTIGFNDGSRWQLKPVATDATKYGGAGETIFLEVGPHTKPCTAGVQRTQCLQVREVRYDGAGRKTIAGDWGNFYGNIDGYKHEPGYRNVLRVKRYTVQNPPADASRFAYVLDMRVETEATK